MTSRADDPADGIEPVRLALRPEHGGGVFHLVDAHPRRLRGGGAFPSGGTKSSAAKGAVSGAIPASISVATSDFPSASNSTIFLLARSRLSSDLTLGAMGATALL